MNKALDDRKAPAVWDRLAGAYASSRQVSVDQLVEWPAQLRLVGNPAGLDILDVGCGTGEKVRYFASAGAKSALGIDPSAGFAGYWTHHPEMQGLSFIQGGFEDLTSLPALRERYFDLIVCFQALMYSRNVAETVRALAGLLRPQGALVFSVPHPFRFALLKNEREGWGLGLAYQHTEAYRYPSPWNSAVCLEHATPRISDYLNALAGANLRLVQCDEPAVPQELRRAAPEKAAWMERYVGIIVFRAERIAN